MNRILVILLAALTFFFGADVANSVLADLDGDAEKVAYYLQENVFVLNYMDEQMGYDGDIEAIGRVEKLTVLSDKDDYYAYFCEFANDKGYLLLADDYVLLDYVRGEASPYKDKYYVGYYYNELTGRYLYETPEGRVLSTNPDENTDIDYPAGSSSFHGLNEITQYVNDKYGSGYVRYIGIGSGYQPLYDPDDLVVYLRNGQAAEENCALTASFFLFQAMKYSNILTNFPANNSTSAINIWHNEKEAYQIEVDLLRKTCKYASTGSDVDAFPTVYATIRNYASTHFYTVENLNDYQTRLMLEYVADVYNTPNFYAATNTDWQQYSSFVVTRYCDYGYCSLFKAKVNGKYHVMPVMGYTIYEKKVKILWWTTTRKITFYDVLDSDYNRTYFDVTGYYGCGSITLTGFRSN